MDKATEMLTFVRAVEAGSFSGAGRALDLTPSAVSKLISRLEDRLGARLIHRTTRQLSLTAEGRAFYDRCVHILGDIEEAERAVTELQGAPRGTLRVNGSVAFSRHQVVPRIGEFLERYPELRIELELNDRFVDLVEEGWDLAIRTARLTDSSLIARPLAVNRRVICAAPGYLARHGTPRRAEELLDHNCITLADQSDFNDWEFEGSSGTRTLRVAGNFESNNGDAVYEAVLAGVGLGRLATFLVGADIRAGRLVAVLPEYAHAQTSIFAVYPHRRHLSPKVRAFVDFLAERFTPVPPWEVALEAHGPAHG